MLKHLAISTLRGLLALAAFFFVMGLAQFVEQMP